ncbi:MAG: 4Fe-4S dicluster domain-containing protein [Acidobacteriota bacterium]|nr:4Fe-4S dicluster domain-containing protein [Blastocatellia bacterium]MDW8238919.1 4Fe-4S dicluster domain-containing protein [Acidobacteriota bacterium]
MTLYLIQEQYLRDWLAEIIATGRRVIAPQSENGLVVYREVTRAETIDLHARAKPDFSFKHILFPQTETVFRYEWRERRPVVEDAAAETSADAENASASVQGEVVVVGATPCDAASLLVLDHVFLADPPDPFYARRRENLIVIGRSCSHAQPECFCTTVGLSPVSTQGCDIFLMPLGADLCDELDIGSGFVAEVLSEKGEALVANVKATWVKPNGSDHSTWLNELKAAHLRAVQAEMLPRRALTPSPDELKKDFEHPAWEEIARACLSCGVCAFVCPTCHCYDLSEERQGRIWSRCRNWDSCAFGYFTLHASGHNPRPTALERYRQRVMHKFCYFLEATGANMCVGCGRCVKFCPVGLDIYQARARWP